MAQHIGDHEECDYARKATKTTHNTKREDTAMETTFTIDCTPQGCKTPEGIERTNKAMEAFSGAQAESALSKLKAMPKLIVLAMTRNVTYSGFTSTTSPEARA